MLADLGVDLAAFNGIFMTPRTPGLIPHVIEEQTRESRCAVSIPLITDMMGRRPEVFPRSKAREIFGWGNLPSEVRNKHCLESYPAQRVLSATLLRQKPQLNSGNSHTYSRSSPTPAATITPTPTATPGQITLTARAYKVQGRHTVDLTWSGATPAMFIFTATERALSWRMRYLSKSFPL